MEPRTRHRSAPVLASFAPASRAVTALVSAVLLIVASCAGPAKEDGDAAAYDGDTPSGVVVEAPAPWTDGFLDAGQIVADVIVIDGPAGLRSHTAIKRDDDSIDYDQQVTSEGLVQTVSLKPDASIPAVTVTLDNWTLHALQRIVVTERPTDSGEVVLRATGDVVAEIAGERVEAPSFVRRYRIGSVNR